MNICLDVRFRTLSGPATAISNLVPELIKKGKKHRFFLLQYGNQHIEGAESAQKIVVPDLIPMLEILWIELVLPLVLKRAECGLYVSFKQPVGPYFSKARKIYYIRYISGRFRADRYPATWKVHLYWTILGNPHLRNSERLIAVSGFVKEFLTEKIKYPEKQVDVIPNGIDRQFRLLSEQETENGRQNLGLPENYILCAGNILPVKNHETAVRVFKRLSLKYPCLRLLIAGNTDTEHFRLVADLAKELEVEDSIIFKGFVPSIQMVLLYNAATLLLFPSLTEACPVAALEAMACGLPIVASDRGAIKEICGDAGLYTSDPTNAGEFEKAVEFMLDKGNRERYRQNALSKSRNYSWENTAFKCLKSFSAAVI